MTIATEPKPYYVTDKIAVRMHQKGTGSNLWVDVTMLRSRVWVPKLLELAMILRGIAWCEDRRYPTGKGRDLLLELLWDALMTSVDPETLRKEYKIPDRSLRVQ